MSLLAKRWDGQLQIPERVVNIITRQGKRRRNALLGLRNVGEESLEFIRVHDCSARLDIGVAHVPLGLFLP